MQTVRKLALFFSGCDIPRVWNRIFLNSACVSRVFLLPPRVKLDAYFLENPFLDRTCEKKSFVVAVLFWRHIFSQGQAYFFLLLGSCLDRVWKFHIEPTWCQEVTWLGNFSKMLSTSPTQTLQKLSLISVKSVYSDNYQGPLQSWLSGIQVGRIIFVWRFCDSVPDFVPRTGTVLQRRWFSAAVFLRCPSVAG